VNSHGFDPQDTDGDTCKGPTAIAGSTRVDMYYNWIAGRVDLSSVSEPSTEPSAEPSTEPSAEPSGEPSSEPSSETDTETDWEAPFGAGEYEDEAGEPSLKVAGCTQVGNRFAIGMWLPMFLSLGLLGWRRRT